MAIKSAYLLAASLFLTAGCPALENNPPRADAAAGVRGETGSRPGGVASTSANPGDVGAEAGSPRGGRGGSSGAAGGGQPSVAVGAHSNGGSGDSPAAAPGDAGSGSAAGTGASRDGGVGQGSSSGNAAPVDGAASGSSKGGASGGGGGAEGGGQPSGTGGAPTSVTPGGEPSEVEPTPGEAVAGQLSEPSSWVGKWFGDAKFRYRVLVDAGLPPRYEDREDSVALTVLIDSFDREDMADGYASITARVSAASCVLTASVQATVFFGDSIATVPAPLLSGTGGGLDDLGRNVGLTLTGKRLGSTLLGTITFESESQPPAPCNGQELPITLSRSLQGR